MTLTLVLALLIPLTVSCGRKSSQEEIDKEVEQLKEKLDKRIEDSKKQKPVEQTKANEEEPLKSSETAEEESTIEEDFDWEALKLKQERKTKKLYVGTWIWRNEGKTLIRFSVNKNGTWKYVDLSAKDYVLSGRWETYDGEDELWLKDESGNSTGWKAELRSLGDEIYIDMPGIWVGDLERK